MHFNLRTTTVVATLVLVLVSVACDRRASRSPTDTELVVPLGLDIEGLDPHTSGLKLQTHTVIANLYDSLVDIDEDLTVRPALAASWMNPDELTWVFTLRPGVTFHTGGTLTAWDVAYSVQRARDHTGSALRSGLSDIVEIAPLSPTVLRLRTKRPVGNLLAQLRGVYVVSKDFVLRSGEERLATTPAGTGSYRLEQRGPDAMRLVAFPACWRGVPHVRHVRFVTSYDIMRRWSKDASYSYALIGRMEPGSIPSLPRGLVVRTTPGLVVWYLGFDLRHRTTPGVTHAGQVDGNPFLDERVRTAISLAVDREELVRRGFQGNAYPVGQLVPQSVFGFVSGMGPPARDLRHARTLMVESGYARGFTARLDTREISADLAQVVAKQLHEIGIRIEPHPLDDTSFFERMARGDTSFYLRRFLCWTGDAQDALDYVLHSPEAAHGYGTFNASSEVELAPGLDAQIERARMEMSGQARLVPLQAVLRVVSERSLVVPLVQSANVNVASPDVTYAPRGDGALIIRSVRISR